MRSIFRFLSGFLVLCVIVALALQFHDPLRQGWTKLTSHIGQQIAGAKGEEEERISSTTAPTETAAPAPVENGEQYYGYRQLSEEEQQVYGQFLSGVQQMQTKFEVSTKDSEVIDRVYEALLADHPELFWLGGYTVTSYMWGDTVRALEIEPDYFYTGEEKERRQQQIEAEANRIVEETVRLFDTEYARARYIYEYLINMVDYVTDTPDNQNICSVFLHRGSVCMGYAKSFQYLVQKLGMECITVSGTADGQAHAWNLLRMEGSYYYVDATWGDSNYTDPGDDRNNVNYLFFGMSSGDIDLNHKSNMKMELPVCNDVACNYYVREGIFYDSFDSGIIGNLIWESKAAGKPFVTFRFADQESYEEAKRYLIEENRVFDYCGGTLNISYRDDAVYRTMTIYY